MESTQFETINSHKIATVFQDTGNKKIVIFCHGFRSSTIGPNRFFVRLARLLEKEGISSLRFDQFGSGNSEGDFLNSSFNDWIATTKEIVNKYHKEGYKIALLGQSMGGAAVLAVAAETQDKISSVVAWVPDASIDTPQMQGDYMEEGGQRVQWDFWKEAHEAQVVDCFKKTKIPEYIFLSTQDEYVSQESQNALITVAQPHQKIEVLQDHSHSSWNYDQATEVIQKTINFIKENF